MRNKHGDTPPKIAPRLKAAPKIRNLYWCDFPEDAQLPEFWKRRPVIVISKTHDLSGHVTAIACTTKPQDDNKWAVKLDTSIDGRESWAICDKPCNIAVSRLIPNEGKIKRLPNEELQLILSKLWEWLPTPPVEKS